MRAASSAEAERPSRGHLPGFCTITRTTRGASSSRTGRRAPARSARGVGGYDEQTPLFVMSLRGELLRVLLRHTVKRATREEPGIGLMRREFNASKRFIAGAAQGTRAVNLDAGGVEGVQITVPRSRSSHQIFYLHGGGYVSGSSAFYRDFIWRIADASAAGVLCVNYRLAPEYPFPAALDDAVNAYRWLLANGAAPERTSLMGD